jgi:hypothetical protein
MLQRALNTLADRGDTHAIYADCRLCSRSVKLKTKQLRQKCGAQFTIAAFRYRLTFATAGPGRGRFGSSTRCRRAKVSMCPERLGAYILAALQCLVWRLPEAQHESRLRVRSMRPYFRDRGRGFRSEVTPGAESIGHLSRVRPTCRDWPRALPILRGHVRARLPALARSLRSGGWRLSSLWSSLHVALHLLTPHLPKRVATCRFAPPCRATISNRSESRAVQIGF